MKYKTKPIIVEARQFTLEAATEMFEYCGWCNSKIMGTYLPPPERAVKIYNSQADDYEVAILGWWVVMYEDHLEAVSDEDFKKLYEVVE